MKKIIQSQMRFRHFSVTFPEHLIGKLDDLNYVLEGEGNFSIGRSFILRFALEELLKRSDAREAIIDRKIDHIRGRQLV